MNRKGFAETQEQGRRVTAMGTGMANNLSGEDSFGHSSSFTWYSGISKGTLPVEECITFYMTEATQEAIVRNLFFFFFFLRGQGAAPCGV